MEDKKLEPLPDVPEVRHLEVVLMPNGEIICMGKSLGWYDKMGEYISNPRKK